MPDGVAYFDGSLRLVEWNARLASLVARPLSAGLPLASVIGPDLAALAGPGFCLAAIEGGRCWRGDPVPQGGYALSCRDAAEGAGLRAALGAAEASSRAKSDFLANMSHELRTPLNAIIGFSDVIHSGVFGPIGNARYQEYVLNINQSGRHLLALINDILDLSKVEAGRVELHEEDLSIHDLVGACFRMVTEMVMQAGCLLVMEADEGLPMLRGDGRRLRQVLLNLLSNAVKFTPEGGRVSVRARIEADGGLAITVADTGTGIAPDDIPLVMEEYGRGRSEVVRNRQGTGLGLPLSQRLVALHGGRLDLSSVLGQGTEVTFRLPKERVLG
ncbi:MAG: hypothetical protein HQL40_03180 [Alphaproteobacteria bacterium]|nr:hypothetical protein [Alphaproteobacteria bacterium]